MNPTIADAVDQAGSAPVETTQDREIRRLQTVRAAVLSDRAGRRAALAALAWVLTYALATRATEHAEHARQFLGDVVYLLPVALATVLAGLVVRRTSGRRRLLWQLLLASNVLWLAGDLVWAAYPYLLRREAPFPSVADGLYVMSYVLVPPAVLVAFGGASGRRRVRAVLDAVVVGLAVGALGWKVLIAPQLTGHGMSWATATGIAYPLLGVVIVITLLSVGLAGHRHVAASVWLIGLAFLVSAVTDAGYTYLSVLHEYLPGAWLNVGWQTEAVLLCLAAFWALRHQEGDGQVAPLSSDLALAPVMAGVLVAAALATVDAVRHHASLLYLAVAGLAVLALAVRSVLSVSDTRAVAVRLDAALREQERLAVTDGLTGLYNRRFFTEVLRLEVDRVHRENGRLAVLVADLDHFKRVNDTYGHQSGDAVLAEAAARLKRALRDSDVLARYGGEEFVMILPGADASTALEVAERCRQLLSEEPMRLHSGTRITVTASFGVACTPGNAMDTDVLIRRADQALYAAKDSGRDRVQMFGRAEAPAGTEVRPPRTGTGLAGVAGWERIADLVDARLGPAEHSIAMTRWVGVLADALGLDPATRARAVLAARLHDIGKIALPDAVLGKQGPLTEDEWQLMRTHPVHGARLLADIPGYEQIAEIVGGHHERYSGGGYPSGVPARQLPIETRLVSVCDAWAAMRVDRPYARALPVADARAELAASRGSQHDPDLTDLFLRLEASGLVGQLEDSSRRRALPAARDSGG